MDIMQAKLDVIKAGKLLCERGLIQRTWGNVSCRIDENSFAITPSGRDYLGLTPDDIVIVNISDLSYEGDVKPSSEKGVHAACYALRKNINFVIHTHQTMASVAGLKGYDINHLEGKSAEIIGKHVPLAAYGLPGTKTLREGVKEAIERSSSKAVLMKHHGAVCMGTDLDDAFIVANELEEACKNIFLQRYKELTGRTIETFGSLCEYISNTLMSETCAEEIPAYNSERLYGVFEMTPVDGGDAIMIDLKSGKPLDSSADYPAFAELHAEIYKKRKDINAITHSKEQATSELSKTGITVRPFLDDFAQIVGVTMKTADYDINDRLRSAKKAVRKMKHRDAVMIKHNGAVCAGSSMDEANAVKLVAEKGCKAYVAASAYGREDKYINPLECTLMRIIYKTKYSKKK
ncbi:MAG: class II aldolase/adducin family protein [Clostridia bacterium]|nr:class II aldolase/adducin family protein [Clostridia bacterium]